MLAVGASRVGAPAWENPSVTGYYDNDTANARLASLRPLLAALRDARDEVAAGQLRLTQLQSSEGSDPALIAREQQGLTITVQRMELAVRQIDAWGVTLRDIGSGQVDFPALADGRPYWLCWKLGEPSVSHQHREGQDCSYRQESSET
jgi:hypothetical protein